MFDKLKLEYRNPIRLSVNDQPVKMRTLLDLYISMGKDGYMFEGWLFNLDYSVIYLKEKDKWKKYYIPPNGIKNYKILDVGGGCGETAKFFTDNGANFIDIIEPNSICWHYLEVNKKNHKKKIRNIIKTTFNPEEINFNEYDLVKLDIEGYEMDLLPFLEGININIVLESHNLYTVNKFLKAGFKMFKEPPKNIQLYGLVTQLYKWVK